MGQVLLCTLPWDPTLPTYFSSDLMSQLGGFSSGSTGQWLNEMRDLLHCGEHLSMQSLGRKCILALTVNWNSTFAYTDPALSFHVDLTSPLGMFHTPDSVKLPPRSSIFLSLPSLFSNSNFHITFLPLTS